MTPHSWLCTSKAYFAYETAGDIQRCSTSDRPSYSGYACEAAIEARAVLEMSRKKFNPFCFKNKRPGSRAVPSCKQQPGDVFVTLMVRKAR